MSSSAAIIICFLKAISQANGIDSGCKKDAPGGFVEIARKLLKLNEIKL